MALAGAPGVARAQARIVADRIPPADSAKPRPAPSPVLVALLSAGAPGAGQYVLRLDRWIPIAAGELFGWWEASRQNRSARNYERRFRDVAWQVARRVSVGARRDTVFEYYELLSKGPYNSSGPFDMDPRTSALEPDTTPGTFNAYIWKLARDLNLGGSAPVPGTRGYENALAYYRENAIPPTFAWDWGTRYLEQQVYVDLVHRADATFRRRDRTIALILANHAASAVDAFVAARLRTLTGFQVIEVRTGFEPDGADVRWQAAVRVGWPRGRI
ncbi:MAG TPA: hypothetical protein VFQ38_16935 [Longimicrobiales bacterium]|nr:hypothetical protein [Longimicrobiales bacterium]